MRQAHLLFALSIIFGCIACGKDIVTACVPELDHALEITAVDSVTGLTLPEATIVVTAFHGFYDSVDVVVPTKVFAGDDSGSYSVVIRATGSSPRLIF